MEPEALLACPTCKRPLRASRGGLTCDRCHTSYPSVRGVWDLRTAASKVAAGGGGWDLGVFEAAYDTFGDYASSLEKAARAGIPEEIEEYRYSRIKGRLIEWGARISPVRAVLDVGCGVGYFLLEVADQLGPGSRIHIGIDVVPGRVRSALKRFDGREGFLPGLASAEDLPFPDATFDLVFCTEVMEHIARPERAFREIRRVLRPEGMLCFSSPNRTATMLWERIFTLPRIARRVMRGTIFRGPEDPYDVPLGHRRLLRLFRRSGLAIDRFHRSVFLPHESYYQFLPAWMNRGILAAGSFLERRAPALAPWIGLHYVVLAHRLP